MKRKKILLLGSGALKIGEAGEFDFSGSQAIKALKEEKIQVILINPNIATIQTSKMADKVYFLPITPYFVEKVIKKEKPQGILLGFGGQTALNCGIELEKKGTLKKFNVKVLGTPIKAIEETEDRKKFIKKLKEIKVKTPPSIAVHSVSEGMKAAKKIGFPVMVRAAFALGGKGSGITKNKKELEKKLRKAFAFAKQVLIEKYLEGFKEIEYEVVRDKFNNCITVCNMENLDPMGIHTGESIVVAPSQTLTNQEYHYLRETSIKVVKHLGIIGECNIQFALNPKKAEYYVIEVNARLSRSSALASKATGYPLAFIAAKLALGYSLNELKNSITKKTVAFFEPAMDYCVIKIPRWDLNKFRNVSTKIDSQMKSVGEVMAIGRKFEEVIQKALRMTETGVNGIETNTKKRRIEKELREASPERIHAIASAIKKNYSIKKISELTKIDKWFLFKIKNIIELEKKLEKKKFNSLTRELLLEAKRLGFSDKQIAIKIDSTEKKVREKRFKEKIIPAIKQIDTLAAEYPAKTNYLYLSYNAEKDDIKPLKGSVIVLGGGPYRIGSSVEFDWCCVNTLKALKKTKFRTIMINCNPETVSTDYDESNKLYFEELSLESILEIYRKEKPKGVIISMGGQTPNNLALKLKKNKIRVLGTKVESIELAENRNKFSKLLDSIEVNQPEWKEVSSFKETLKFAKSTGFPVLVRPSYVLSGTGMAVAFNEKELKNYLKKFSEISKKQPTVISKFIINAREIEIDGIAKNGKILIYAITEHVENAGIHSGDATIVLPPQKIYLETINKIKRISKQIALKLKISGPFNIQFIAKDNEIKVIECNLRASRSFPFCSKVTGKNFIEYAIKAMLNKPIKKTNECFGKLNYIGVKAPQFSFSRLSGADPISGVEMTSTGEVACLGKDIYDAFLKAMLSANNQLPKKNVLVSIGGEENKYALLKPIQKLAQKGLKIYATKNTHKFLKFHGIKSKRLFKVQEKKEPNVLTYLTKRKIDFIINVPDKYHSTEWDPDYTLRRTAVDFNIPLTTNLELTKLFVKSITEKKLNELEIKSWNEYLKKKYGV
jgi:carbamoyl-phosphate synthase large subunit